MPASDYCGVDQDSSNSASDAAALAALAAPLVPRRWAAGVGALACAACATLAVAHFGSVRPMRSTANEGVVELANEGGVEMISKTTECAGPEGECTNSQCCLEGGPSGYQCYAKNDGWAQCLEKCEKGAHEDETDGHYDESGNFVKEEWSCKKLGERSLKGCDALEKKNDCVNEKDRCFWGWKDADTRACQRKCSSMDSAGGCNSLDHCMWHEDTCKPGCNTYDKEKRCPVDQCMWQSETCKPACWTMMDVDSCEAAKWDQGCIWQGGQCIVDPCAAGDEDCIDSKCCSAARGGQGKMCFKKDKYYAKCMEYCDEDGWDCKALGNRTKWGAGCSWIGKDCSETKLCCQAGSSCAVKDELFTGCVQTQEISSWDSRDIPIPPDWDGTILGGSRDEYQVPAAGEGEEEMGTTLFCFMAYLPGSTEVELMQTAKDNGASIYACDEHAEFESWQSDVQQWDTGGEGASLANTDVFLNVWLQVEKDGRYLKADWTAKVDPDALVVPDRLRAHIAALSPPANRPIYLKNNGMDPGLGNNGFLGAIEVFSKQAVQIYFDNWEGCKEGFGLDSGEDGFFKGCMDALGVGFMTDANMFNPDYDPAICGTNLDRAAFHPIKDPNDWLCCWDLINGNERHAAYGHCDPL